MPGVRSYFVHKLLRARHWQPRPQFLDVCDWWRSGGQGVCSLIGIGGAGKTAIADRFLQTLPEVLDDSPNVPKDETLPLPESVFVFSFYDSPNPEDFFNKLNEWLEFLTPMTTVVEISETGRMSYHHLAMRLQDAPPSLLILDGLEKIQEDGTRGGIFGRIAHGSLRNFVTRLADGYHSKLSVLITSRFSLADLEEETPTHYRPINIEEIDLPTGIHLLRDRGVTGSDDQLASIVKNCGHHALTVDMAGGFLVEFHKGKPTVNLEIGSPEEIEEAVKSEQDPKRRSVLKQELRFAKVAGRYRQALQKDDKAALALLERVCLFRLGADTETLASIFTGKGTQKVAGHALCRVNAEQLQQKLDLLVRMGLLEENRRPDQAKRSSGNNNPDTTNDSPEHRSARSGLLYTIHPAVRDGFLKALAPEDKLNSHEAVRKGLEVSLGDAPGENPSDPATLDLLEEIVHHTLQSGHVPEAWDIHRNRIGGYKNLGWRLGAYERGERICRAFAGGLSPESIVSLNREPTALAAGSSQGNDSATPESSAFGSQTQNRDGDQGKRSGASRRVEATTGADSSESLRPSATTSAPFLDLPEATQGTFINEWARYVQDLGRLAAAARCYELGIEIAMRQENSSNVSVGNQNLCEVWLLSGRLSRLPQNESGKLETGLPPFSFVTRSSEASPDTSARLGASSAGALATADEALRLAELADDTWHRLCSLAYRAHILGLVGKNLKALADFRTAVDCQHESEREHEHPLSWLGGIFHSLFLTRLGRIEQTRAVTNANNDRCVEAGNHFLIPKCQLVLSSLSFERSVSLSSSSGSSAALWTQARDWALDRDAKEVLCWSCLVEAQHALARSFNAQPKAPASRESSDTQAVAFGSALNEAHDALEAGLKIARNYGFGLYHIDLLLERARLHLLRGDVGAALDDVEMALGDEEGGGGIPANEKTGQSELLAARNVECGYAWPVPFGLQLRAEALLLQAAQEIGDDSFVPAKLSGQSDTFRQRIEQAKENLAEAMDLWQPLHDPEPERPDQNFQRNGTEYNYRAEETHCILTDLDAGLLTPYPLSGATRAEAAGSLNAKPSEKPIMHKTYSGTVKLTFCRDLGADWKDLTTLLEIPQHRVSAWEKGDEARGIWQFLEERKQLNLLPAKLRELKRDTLAGEFAKPVSARSSIAPDSHSKEENIIMTGLNLGNRAKAVFVSYSHKNKDWLDRLKMQLAPLEDQDELTVCSDEDIPYGADWHDHIQTHLNGAKAAVLLISAPFLASEYVRSSELPVLLKNAKDQGVVIIPVLVSPSQFTRAKYKYPDPKTGPDEFILSSLQAAATPDKTLIDMDEAEQERTLIRVAERLLEIVANP